MSVERSKRKKSKPGVRLFVGVYPPADIAEQLVAQIRRLDLPDHRLTPAAQIHLTVQFLGERPESDIDTIVESIARSASGLDAFDLSIERLINFPPNRLARMVAAETSAPPSLRELHQRLTNRLANNPRPAPDRQFRPHMTVCRFKRPKRGFALQEELSLPPFDVGHVSLMRSTLHPDGAKHTLIEDVTLG